MEVDQIENDDVSSKVIELPVLKLIKKSQNAHGLRHQDFKSYKIFCTKKLARLRKVAFSGTKTSKASQKSNAPTLKLTLELISTNKHLEIILFESERAWAMAQYIKSSVMSEPRKKHHLIKRMKRAYLHADSLKSICRSLWNSSYQASNNKLNKASVDTSTVIEVEGYYFWMKCQLEMTLKKWKDSLLSLIVSYKLYQHLSQWDSSSSSEFLTERLNELEKNVRFILYQLKTTVAESVPLYEWIEKEYIIRKDHIEPEDKKIYAELHSQFKQESMTSPHLAKSITFQWMGKQISFDQPTLIKELELIKTLSHSTSASANENANDDNVVDKIARAKEALRIVKRANRDLTSIYPCDGDAKAFIEFKEKALEIDHFLVQIGCRYGVDAIFKSKKNSRSRRKVTWHWKSYSKKIIQCLEYMKGFEMIKDNSFLEKALNTRISLFGAYFDFIRACQYFQRSQLKESAMCLLKVEEALPTLQKDYKLYKDSMGKLEVSEEEYRMLPSLADNVHQLSNLVRSDFLLKTTHQQMNDSLIKEKEKRTNSKKAFSSIPDYLQNILFPIPSRSVAHIKPIFYDLAFDNFSYPDISSDIKHLHQLDEKRTSKEVSGSSTESASVYFGESLKMNHSKRLQILSLYHSLLKAAIKFPQYNYRVYALTKIKDTFRSNKSEKDPQSVEKWLKKGLESLEMMKRQTSIQHLYMNDQNATLVVESELPSSKKNGTKKK